jgi:molybdopterin-binding protein
VSAGGDGATIDAATTGLTFDATVAERDVSVRFALARGENVALLGPNGAGKSTVLGVIAGLIVPTQGTVTLNGRDVTGLPPHRRRVALLDQDALLFPHLTALDNVAFGPQATGIKRATARATAQHWLEATGVGELAARKPAHLSGGQAQRVAIARALAGSPDLLLLDEPMAALDAEVAPALRQTLKSVLAERTTLIVTHDVIDALVLADRVIIVEQGRIADDGPTADVLRRPRSAFGASIAGLNLVSGIWRDGHVVHPSATLAAMPTMPAPRDGDGATAVFSPAAVSVYLERPGGSPRNVLAGTVTSFEPMGDRVRVRTLVGDLPVAADVTPGAVADLGLAEGTAVWLSVKATELTAYPHR